MNTPLPPPPLPGQSTRPVPPPSPYYEAAPARPSSTAAIVSLISGILSWIMLPLIAAPVAIIAGHMARSEIRRSNGTMDGDGLAIAGMILGYIQVALAVLAIVAIFLFFGGLAAFIAASQ